MNRIKIDSDRKIGRIPDTLFGSFLEHLGHCIYGGIVGDGKSVQTDEEGLRLDVLNAVQELKPSIIRWPGGNFVSGYHWMDGIGPKEERRVLQNLAWGQKESNQFGTDEFLSYCRKIKAQPLICVNMGTGTMEEARNWVEYCNGKTGTYYADLRKQNGHDEPYQVKYWGIGNEMNGSWQIGQLSAADFGKKARETAKLMKWADPDIRLILAGHCTDEPDSVDYDRTLLDATAEYIDLYSIHMYARNDADDFRQYMAYSEKIRRKIQLVNSIITASCHKVGKRERIRLSFDEWNVYYREDSTASNHCEICERYNLEDALVVSMFLNALIKNCDTVEIACQALMVNAAASIVTNEKELFLQTIFYPMWLFYNLHGKESLDALVTCGSYDTREYRDVPFLDVSVTKDDEKQEIVIFVVNKDMEKAETQILIPKETIIGEAQVYQVYHQDIKAENSFDEKNKVGIQKSSIPDASGSFSYSFAPHSLTVIRLRYEEQGESGSDVPGL